MIIGSASISLVGVAPSRASVSGLFTPATAALRFVNPTPTSTVPIAAATGTPSWSVDGGPDGYVDYGYQYYYDSVTVVPPPSGTGTTALPASETNPTGPSHAGSPVFPGFLGTVDQPTKIFFAWVAAPTPDAPLVPFDSVAHAVEDEKIFSFNMDQREGSYATLSLEIQNPGMGLLAPGRATWAWFSIQHPITLTVVPVFFGRLVSTPSDMTSKVITINLVSSPINILLIKRRLAESLKVYPYYDPIFVEDARRNDPDTVLEGYSALWHVDRTTLETTVSDLIAGEDGEEVFEQTDAFYESVKIGTATAPLRSISVFVTASWVQEATGIVAMKGGSWNTLAASSLASSWPKPMTGIGQGWTVYSAWASDSTKPKTGDVGGLHINYPQVSYSVSWKWPETPRGWDPEENRPRNGDCISWNASYSFPTKPGAYFVLRQDDEVRVIGELPFQPPPGDDQRYKDPQFVEYIQQMIRMYPGKPASMKIDKEWTVVWGPDAGQDSGSGATAAQVVGTLSAQYQAARERHETVRFVLRGDLQPVVTSTGDPAADFSMDQELLELNVIVGLEDSFLYGKFRGEWSTNTYYNLYDIVTYNGAAYQVGLAHSGGTFDTSAPWFTTFYRLIPNFRGYWQPNIIYVAGDLFYIDGTTPLTDADATAVVNNDFTLVGSSDFLVFKTLVGHTSATTFDPLAYDSTIRLLYALVINPPAIGDVGRRSFFPTDRGKLALEHSIQRARARIIGRSRALQVAFECPFWRAVTLSCRKMARLYDARLPGGNAVGKIVAYSLYGSGDRAEIGANVTIACAVGNGGDTYAGDVSYTIPQDTGGNDDGLILTSPLTYNQVVLREIAGSVQEAPSDATAVQKFITDQLVNPANAGAPVDDIVYTDTIINLQMQAALNNAGVTPSGAASSTPPTVYNVSPNWNLPSEFINNYAAQQANKAMAVAVAAAIADYNSTIPAAQPSPSVVPSPYYMLVLKPVTNGPFSQDFDLQVSDLKIRKQVDLAAASNP